MQSARTRNAYARRAAKLAAAAVGFVFARRPLRAPRPEGAPPAADRPDLQPAARDVCAPPLPWARQQDEELETSALPLVLAPSPSAWM